MNAPSGQLLHVPPQHPLLQQSGALMVGLQPGIPRPGLVYSQHSIPDASAYWAQGARMLAAAVPQQHAATGLPGIPGIPLTLQQQQPNGALPGVPGSAGPLPAADLLLPGGPGADVAPGR